MDWILKPCTTTTTCTNKWEVRNHDVSAPVDWLTKLPIELLIRILSLLPTKDAAAASVLSWRLRSAFPFITNLDFDVSPISLCLNHPFANATERYSAFVSFVNTVLRAHQSKYLTRFRLKVGNGDLCAGYVPDKVRDCCSPECLPDLKSTQFNKWISFPLTLVGLRELDLCILVREPGDAQLPTAIFTCQTLQVLKLQVNLGFDQVISMPSYCLPNLKLLALVTCFISDSGFLPRLVSSCPLLEDLKFEPFTNHLWKLSIFSTSLRKLSMFVHNVDYADHENTEAVDINTPNLEYLSYNDFQGFQYSIPQMHCLVKAKLSIYYGCNESQPLFDLIEPVSYVQHLAFYGCLMQEFSVADVNVLKDQLPMFPNLNHLEVDNVDDVWNTFLLHLFNCTPVLETLHFDMGVAWPGDENCCNVKKLQLELEREFFRSNHPIPSCFRYHLKRIVIKKYLGIRREVEMIQFFLRHALVLEELVVVRLQSPAISTPDQMHIENTLKDLRKASPTCLIRVL